MSQPARSWNGVIVHEHDNFGVALGESTIARAAKATNWFNYITRRELQSRGFSLIVPRAIVDDDQFIGCGLQMSDSFQAFPQGNETVARANDYRGGQLYVLVQSKGRGLCGTIRRGLQSVNLKIEIKEGPLWTF